MAGLRLQPVGHLRGATSSTLCAGLEQQTHLALGHGTPADDEDAAAVQVGKEREIAHRQPSSPCRPHSRFKPKNRVASASPASASVRVVCQSPIET